MQRTPNLGLPQFEPTDKYRLEDYNEAYMKIDEKVKELKDKEEQLNTRLAEAQSVIDTWETFKSSGGEIGGDLIASTLKSWGDTMVDGNLWIGSFSREQTGYTKLPNGLIMQWGTWVKTATETNSSVTYTITFPTSFPNTCLQIVPYASAFATTGNWAPQNCASVISDYSTSDFKFKFSTVTNIRNELNWRAIGY